MADKAMWKEKEGLSEKMCRTRRYFREALGRQL